MMKVENSVLSIEERILLSSLGEETPDKCIEEIDKLISGVTLTDESYPILRHLRYKLEHFPINILSEIATVVD